MQHKSIDIYLSYALVALIFTAFALPVSADCQFQLQDGNRNLHAVYGPTTDDERKLIPPNEAGIDVLEDGRWTFQETFLHSGNCGALAPEALRNLRPYQTHQVHMLDTCTVTDTDGETREFLVWGTRFTRVYPPKGKRVDGCYYQVDIWGYEP